IRFEGNCKQTGEAIIQARIIDGRRGHVVRDWLEVGRLKKGALRGEITALPTGGPYTVELALIDKQGKMILQQSYPHILVGDVWILAGQSNMQGRGELEGIEEPSIFVHAYGFDEHWNIASEPLHWLLDSIDPVHHRGLEGEALEKRRQAEKAYATTGAGLGLTFAKTMVEATGAPVGLVPCAHGGTSMEQWNPEKRDEGGLSLYGSMYRRFQAVGGRIKGILWYQGEAECNAHAAPLYTERMKKLVAAIRRDFNDADLPFYLVQLGRYITASENHAWSDIREQQRLLPQQLPYVGVAAAIDLTMDDAIHIGTAGLKRLGHRLAQLVLRAQFNRSDIHTGPQLAAIQLLTDRFPIYRLLFESVNGRLQAAGRVNGFSLRDADGRDLRLIFKAIVSQDGRAIDLYLRQSPPAGSMLWYGYGVDPYCNVADALDMALPAFGPVHVDEAAYAAFIHRAKEKPDDPALITMLPQAISLLHRKPECKSEVMAYIQIMLKNAPERDCVLLYPYLFALGDFNKWSEWLRAVRQADLTERKRLASSWKHAADFPDLPCPFVKDYLIVGPFDNSEDRGFDRAYSPETQTDLSAVFTDAMGASAALKAAQSEPHGFLDFLVHFKQQEDVVAYALVRVTAEKEAEIPILLGSDDAAAVWVNGVEIHREHVHRSAAPAQDLLLAPLKKGENRVLVKVGQAGGDWGLYLQLIDRDGILQVQ
ncbi:sialate O-acetylesterase, partial [candidate division KSB1 bacterium]|nr:sialate O-acetylesterase [candidate division KSB1 bacterium]